jgi:hypothetical protein
MLEAIQPYLVAYRDAKRHLGEITGASEDLLHIHAGLLIFVVTALVLRKKMRSPVPLALVFLFALLNEVIDVLAGGDYRALEPYVDFANTVFWPTILFLAARRWR